MAESQIAEWRRSLYAPTATILVRFHSIGPEISRDMKVTRRSHWLRPTGKHDFYPDGKKLVPGIWVTILKKDENQIWREIGSAVVPLDRIELLPEEDD
ncbi:hypothetical protein KKI23_01255 [Patescibacteria group bacterium]|nr:hypothetical protein [Patescibacteria group bacterium]